MHQLYIAMIFKQAQHPAYLKSHLGHRTPAWPLETADLWRSELMCSARRRKLKKARLTDLMKGNIQDLH